MNVDGKPTIPPTLNVLTILTFIGCGVGLLFMAVTPLISKFFLGMLDKAKSSGKEFSAKELADMEKGRAAMELFMNNYVTIVAIGLVGIVLCLVGAIWMRRLKKDGFWIYTAGELLPLVANLILLGTAQFAGAFSVFAGVGIPVLFVILYAGQRKYLVN
jgi:hypothetical protein